jgi:large subunit ribosomal protein L25
MSDITETVLQVNTRDQHGSSLSKKLRSQGSIPAVFYGKNILKHYSVNDSGFRALMRASGGSISLIELEEDSGSRELALLKDMQVDAVKDQILHLDFIQVTRGEDLTAKVPLVVTGEALGVKSMGGILEIHLNEIEVRCRPSKLPNQIVVDVSDLNIGESLQLKDLASIADVEFIGDIHTNLVSCVGSASGRASADSGEEEEEQPEEQTNEPNGQDSPSEGE